MRQLVRAGDVQLRPAAGFERRRYDAVEEVLHLTPAIQGDFRCFISTATGYGTVGIEKRKAVPQRQVGADQAESDQSLGIMGKLPIECRSSPSSRRHHPSQPGDGLPEPRKTA